jgi:DNA repair exonuclease SbcCD ATPase subunit
MSQLLNSLATIEVSQEIVKQLDLESIYSNFSKNYRKLDDLKDFRSEYEKKNKLMRWWHNDKLRGAQLDSAEVQAEFSKTIGQLLMISIMQSKKLAEQQNQLNQQQGALKEQADGIAMHTQELQVQHRTLAEQSERLETLVREYFELKGLTEDGAQKLIQIAKEIKSAKEGMQQEFAQRAADMEMAQSAAAAQLQAACADITTQLRTHADKMEADLSLLEYETKQTLVKSEGSLRAEWSSSHETLRRDLQDADRLARELHAQLHSSTSEFALRLTNLNERHDEQQQQQQRLTDVALTEQSSKLDAVHQRIAAQEVSVAAHDEQLTQVHTQWQKAQADLTRQLGKLKLALVGLGGLAVLALAGLAHFTRWI